MLSRRDALASLSASAAIGCTRAVAQSSFWTGKTLNIIVGSSTGGYYDTAGRTIARHIGRFIQDQHRTQHGKQRPGSACKRIDD